MDFIKALRQAEPRSFFPSQHEPNCGSPIARSGYMRLQDIAHGRITSCTSRSRTVQSSTGIMDCGIEIARLELLHGDAFRDPRFSLTYRFPSRPLIQSVSLRASDDLCLEAGSSPPSLYNHSRDREAVPDPGGLDASSVAPERRQGASPNSCIGALMLFATHREWYTEFAKSADTISCQVTSQELQEI